MKILLSELEKLRQAVVEFKNTSPPCSTAGAPPCSTAGGPALQYCRGGGEKSLQDLSGDDLLKAGLGFTALLSGNSDFYILDDKIIAKNKSIRYVIPKPNLHILIQNIALMDTIELPMIIPPYE